MKEFKETRIALKQKQNEMQTLIDYLPDIIWLKDKNSRYLQVNKAFAEQCGMDHDHILGKRVTEVWSGDVARTFVEDDEKVFVSGKTIQEERSITDSKGCSGWVEIIEGPTFDEKERMAGSVGIARNITERKHSEIEKKELESQLRQSQKMEAIGTLAGGIAHDFNNILAAMMGYAEISLDETGDDSKIRHRLERILKAGQRGKELVDQILTFSRQNEKERKSIRLSSSVEETLKMLRPLIPRNIEIRSYLSESTSVIKADPTQIHQILINLCTNSSFAMREKGGILELRVEDVELHPEDASKYVGVSPGPHARLTVSDTGHGFDSEVKQRVFEPFFTTKKHGEGTGMGLAVVHGIVKSLNGKIFVDSEPERGTTFQVYIPRIDADEACVETQSKWLSQGNECILFVDDEVFIVDMAKEMLESLGYEVLPFRDSLQALDCFKSQKDRIQLVITDQAMPNMTGENLSKELIRIRPDIPIILCTGFSETVSVEKAKSLGIKDYLMKPFIKHDLAAGIRKVLDQHIP